MCKQTPVSELSGLYKGHTRLVISFCVVLMLVCLSAISGQAQVLYGSLTGTVTDSSGAAVSGAKVEALNTGTGITRTTTSNDSGLYSLQALQAGNYKVTISSGKFASQVTDNVKIVVNNVSRIDALLKVAASAEDVTVTAEAPVLQTDKADVHTDLTSQQITSLPTMSSQGRNFQSLLRIIPGVGLTAETNSISGNPQRAINANVNGQSNQSVNTRIDGAQDLYPWLPANVAYVPPADAIETVNVSTNSFDAEQGMAGGAAVNVQIKSGTNRFHGSGHEFHTDQNFAARNYFNTDITRFPKLNRNNQNQFGGTFGGPILKDKLFFFTDYERTTQRNLAGPVNRILPTAQLITGDFRNLPGNPIIYDPRTGDATGHNRTQISCNGVLNVICPADFDPAAVKLIALMQPNFAKEFADTFAANNFTASGTALFNRDNFDVKINYVPSQKSTVFGRYSFSKSLVFDPPIFGSAGGDAANGGQLGNSTGLIQSVGLGGTYTFSPNMLLDWNAGYTRQRLGASFDLESARGVNELGIPGANGVGEPGDPTLYNGLPAFTFNTNFPGTAPASAFASLGNTNTGNPFTFRDNQYVAGLNLSYTRGKHAFRGGIEWNHAGINHFQPQGGTFQTPRGTFEFNGTATSTLGTNAKGDTIVIGGTPANSWADFLLGLPSATGKAGALFNPTALRWSQWAWYLRDQFQVTPKLTLTLGVRWEYYPFGYSDNGKGLRYFDPNTGNVLIGGYGNVPQDDGIDTGHGQFLPRIGAAYRLTSSTVIRAGYGMSADPNNWRYFRNAYPSALLASNTQANSTTVIPVASLSGKNAALGSGGYTAVTGLQNLPVPDVSSGVIPLPTNAGTTTIPNPFHRGYINSFNLILQQEWKGFVLETGYVGARAIRPLVNLNLNASAIGAGQAGGLINADLRAKGVACVKASGATLVPDPTCNYGNIGALVPFKNNYYDSLQTKVTRRFTGGTQAGFVWTWSKAIDYRGNEELNSLLEPFPDYWDRNRAVADFDRTHNVKIYGILTSPFGKGQHYLQEGWGGKILGGWQLDPVISYLTGLPFSVTANGNTLNGQGATQFADLVGTYKTTDGKPARAGQTCVVGTASCSYFDPSAFATPPVGRFGNTSRNQFRGPGYFEMDLALARDFRLTERFNLQIRGEAFSLTNTPHFANPNGSCPASTASTSCATGTFGQITGAAQPGGFFGPDPGSRTIWLAAKVTF